MVVVLLCFLSVLFTYPVNAQVTASRIQAEWITTLLPYISWPNGPHTTLTLCSIGQDSVTSFLIDMIENMKQESKASGKQPGIKLERKSAKSDFIGCHALYISPTEQYTITDILKKTQNEPILTFSTILNFASKGGIVEFYIKNDEIVIRINEKTASTSRLIIDSDLLGFVERVR
jgi:hypothetical protein